MYSVASQKWGAGGDGYRERKKEEGGEGKGKAEAWKLKVKYLIDADICGYKHIKMILHVNFLAENAEKPLPIYEG